MSYAFLSKVQDRWSATNAAAASGGVSATKAAVTGGTHNVTNIACSSDAAAVVTIQSPSGTTIWRQRFAAAFAMNVPFYPGVLMGAADEAVLVNVSASTSNVEANINGLTI